MGFAFPPLTPLVRAILIALFASFVVQTVVDAIAGPAGEPLFTHLALHYDLGLGTLWQWATYPLTEYGSPGAPMARALDLLFIYLWIAPFELEHGRRKTAVLVALAVVCGALLPFALGMLPHLGVALPERVLLPLAGARALTWAGIGALVVRSRGAPMNFFLLPTMTATQFAGVFLILEALQCAWMGTPIPLLASLGGLAAGVFYTRHLDRPRTPKKPPPAKRRAGGSHLHVIPGGQSDDERPRWLN